MHALIQRITDRCIFSQIIEKSDAEWLAYALEKRITTTITAALFFAFGSLISNIYTAAAFLFSFYFLRLRTNGFHAKSFVGCMAISLLLEALLLYGLPRIMSHFLFFALLGGSFLIIFMMAPFNDGNMHLDESEYVACRCGSRIRIAINSALAIGFYFGIKDVGIGLALGNTMTALLLIIANIKKEIEK